MNTENSTDGERQSDQPQKAAGRDDSKKGSKSASKQQRLANALRSNLSRRKDQKKRRTSGAK